MERLASLREQSAVSSLLTKLSRREIPSLYGLRGMAALAVLIYHFSDQRGLMAHFPGPFAVTLFFELSGLLITWLLLKEMDKRGRANLRQFYSRRALRLFPVFYVVWILYRLARPFPGSWATFFYMGDYYYAVHQRYSAMTIAWSLGLEEKFYLLWPLVLARIAQPRLIKILCAMLIAEPVYRFFLIFLGHRPYTWFAFDCRLDALVLGCLIALLAKDGWTPPKWISHPCTPLGPLILVLALQNDVAVYALGVVLVSTVARPTWFLNNPVSGFLGVISYSLYLCHAAAREILWPLIASRFPVHKAAAAFLAQFLLALAAASLLHSLVEWPFLRLKDRFHRPQPRISSPARQQT